jgi:Ca2+-binding EF-hand superfamily protein
MGMKLSAEEAAKMIEELDEDKDGFLSWEEFRKAVVE